jgi:hypothetical protein
MVAIPDDGRVVPSSFWLHVEQISRLRDPAENQVSRMPEPYPDDALFIVRAGFLRCSLELRRIGKGVELREEMDEIDYVDWPAIVSLGPRADARGKCLDLRCRQQVPFDDCQVTIDLRLGELACSREYQAQKATYRATNAMPKNDHCSSPPRMMTSIGNITDLDHRRHATNIKTVSHM